MASVLEAVKHYQQSLEKYSNDEVKVLKCIDKLFHLDVTTQHLQETGVGRTVNALRKDPGEVGTAARSLVYKWKRMVASEESDHEGDHRNDSAIHNGNNSGKDSDDNSRQHKSRPEQYDRSKKSNHSQHRQMNGHGTEHKRKYPSSEEEDASHKKKRRSTDEEHKKPINKQEKLSDSESDEDSDSSESDSGSYTSESSHEDTKTKTKEVQIKQERESPERNNTSKSHHKDREEHRKESSSSRSSHAPEKHSSHSSKSKEPRHSSESSSKSSSHKTKHLYERESSTDKRHSNDKPKDEKRDTVESSKHSSKSEKKSSVHKSDNGHDKHRSSSNGHSSKSDKQKSSDRETEKHKSSSQSQSSSSQSDKHRSSSQSDKLKNSSQSERESEKHKSSHSDKSSRHKSSDKESDRHKSSSDKESSKHRTKESSSSSSKDKHSSSSKDKEKSKEKSISSKEKPSSHSEKKSSSDKAHERSKYEHIEDREQKKEKSSSSSHKSKTSSKSGDEVPKKKVKKTNSDDNEEGIDCGSGASFAEALGMSVSPLKTKKKTYKDMSPSNPFLSDLSPATLLAPTAKLAPLPSLEISALPEISPNYKPRPPPKAMPHFTDEDAISAGISSKNQRTKVYSGNKTVGKVTSLYDMCVNILQEHIDALEYTGGVPYEILKPVIDRATPQQLFVLEHYNPYLMEDTDHLWQKNCEKTFRNKKRQEMETFREMYIRCQEEQESKLKSLTANIRLTQEAKKAPIKQTKMAYVDNFVKPPRNVARKQAIHGTAHSASASPAARVAALASAANVLKGGAPRPVNAASVSVSSFHKPKKAPLMQKALQFMRGRKR